MRAGLALDDAAHQGRRRALRDHGHGGGGGGGERDEAVDAAILAASRRRTDLGVLLNEKLTTELRPTLFLAQLSNLLAGNISIVHKVTGSSRTFMGEEGAGVSAVETAAARIRSGQSTHALVGGAFNAEHPDMLLELRARPATCIAAPGGRYGIAAGSEGGGVVTGSGAAFLVLESREHAEQRGASDLCPARPGRVRQCPARRRLRRRHRQADRSRRSGRRGHAGDLRRLRRAQCDQPPSGQRSTARAAAPLRGFATLTGHLKEAQFPFAIALAALAIQRGQCLSCRSTPDVEKAFAGKPEAVLATAVGFYRYEGAALVQAA